MSHTPSTSTPAGTPRTAIHPDHIPFDDFSDPWTPGPAEAGPSDALVVETAQAELEQFLEEAHARFLVLRAHRRQAIIAAAESGRSRAEIGARIGISRQRIDQIIKGDGEPSAPEDLTRAWTTAAARDRGARSWRASTR